MENIPETIIENNAENSQDSGVPMWMQVLVICIALMSIIHCVSTRTFGDIVKYASYVASGLFIVFLLIIAISALRNGVNRRDVKKFVIALPIVVIILSFLGLSNYSLIVGIKDVFLWIISPSLSKTSTVIMASLFTLGLGSGLFFFRLRMRAIYGLTEAAIGIVVAGNRAITQMDQFTSSDFYLAILTASVYLIVRGFDNIHQGLTKEPIDPYGKKLFAFLRRRITI